MLIKPFLAATRPLCSTCPRPHKQLGGPGGHFPLLVQLPACRERPVHLSVRQAAGHSRQPDHSDGGRRYGLQPAESTSGNRLQQRLPAHQCLWRWRRGGLPGLRGDCGELCASVDGQDAGGHASLKEAAHGCRQQCVDLSDRARRRWIPQVPGQRRGHEPGVGGCHWANVAKAKVWERKRD